MTKSDESALPSRGVRTRRPPAGLSAPSVGRPASGPIEINFPAESAALEILRSVVGRAARMAGFSYDGIEDFAMAVDEAATLLVESKPAALVLTLSGMDTVSRLEVVVAAHDPAKAISLADLRDGYRWDLLQALCEEVWWEETGTAIGLAQSIR